MLTHQKAKAQAFTEDQILQIIQNVAAGLKELHGRPTPVIHLNICVRLIFSFVTAYLARGAVHRR
jgi:hypothetical protein